MQSLSNNMLLLLRTNLRLADCGFKSVTSRGLAGISFTKGSKIPINYMTGQKDPLILDDKEYPEWVMLLAEKQPSKTQLMKKLNDQGIDSLTFDDCKRLKRLSTLETIKTNNQNSTSSNA